MLSYSSWLEWSNVTFSRITTLLSPSEVLNHPNFSSIALVKESEPNVRCSSSWFKVPAHNLGREHLVPGTEMALKTCFFLRTEELGLSWQENALCAPDLMARILMGNSAKRPFNSEKAAMKHRCAALGSKQFWAQPVPPDWSLRDLTLYQTSKSQHCIAEKLVPLSNPSCSMLDKHTKQLLMHERLCFLEKVKK